MNQKKKGISLKKNFRRLLKIRVEGRSSAPSAAGAKDKAPVHPKELASKPGSAPTGNSAQKVSTAQSSRPVSISIKDALSRGVPKTQAASKPLTKLKEGEAKYTEVSNEKYTAKSVIAKLKEYALVRKKSDRIRLAIANCTSELQDSGKLIIRVSNQIQLDDIAGVKNEMVNYLKRELRNSTLDFTIEITRGSTSKRLYTDTDKFNYLCKKNPVLEQLKQKFSLDFE